MNTLNKTIKKLTETEYQKLLSAVTGRKNNKPFVVLEAARHKNMDEIQMMDLLQVNASTYYTLKSRLNEKIADFLSGISGNPISELKEKVAQVPFVFFGNDRDVSLRSLKTLEKELIEYDMSNELIVVYKAMARLSLFNGDYDFYEKQYNRHVAYSLSVIKAEDLFFDFTKCMGKFLLTRVESDLEEVKRCIRELSNISELYHGHRLFVLNNIVRMYNLIITTTRKENLAAIEMEVDSILKQIQNHFTTYNMDAFYQSITFIVDYLYFEYYQRAGNRPRSQHHYQLIIGQVPEIALRPMFSFYTTQILDTKIESFLDAGDINSLGDITPQLIKNFYTDISDPYPFISFKRFQAITKFYSGDFSGAAKTINNLRNELSMKKFFHANVECKLFQALNYALTGEDGLCMQLLLSVRRQIADDDTNYESATVFIKMLKAALKPEEFRRKIKHVTGIFEEFNRVNTGNYRILSFLKLDESMLRRLCNPIK